MKPDPLGFVMSFIEASDGLRQQYISRWQETLANFIVEPHDSFGSTRSPYDRNSRSRGMGGNPKDRHRVILKDPETHKAIMTYASKLVRILFSDRDSGYIKSKPRGYEDAGPKSETVDRYLQYSLGLPGHFRTFVESIIDMLLFGTSIIEVGWHYEEREQLVRSIRTQDGFDLDSFDRLRIPTWDDVKITAIDPVDFYPDPSRYRIQDMSGAAKRFKINAHEVRAKSDMGLYDKEASKRVVDGIGRGSTDSSYTENIRAGVDQPNDHPAQSDFKDMIGYEYAGDVPWNDDGSQRRVITIVNGVVVRDRKWPWADDALPWKSLIINPLQGRFYGISPAEVIRWDQSFADAMKMLIAEAAIREVHPPIAYDTDGDIGLDLAKLKAWKADTPIGIRGGPKAVGTLRYDANLPAGFGVLSALKNSMQEASGAMGAIQGEAGPDRESATVGANRMQMAMDRPELAAMVLERECLPPIGQAILRRGQQFLDSEMLTERVGEDPQPVWIGEIMGDFDVSFIGSRLDISRQEKLQSIDRLIAMATAVPPFAAMVPWDKVASWVTGDLLELPEIAQGIPDLRTIMLNQLLQQQQQGGAGANGVAQSSSPPGISPGQATGGILG